MLRYGGIRLYRATTVSEADFLLTVTAGTVLLSDGVFLDGCWADALNMCAGVHPEVAPVVLADLVDREFLSEAFDLGVCCILWRPVEFSQLARTLQAANEASHQRRTRLNRSELPAGIGQRG